MMMNGKTGDNQKAYNTIKQKMKMIFETCFEN